MIDDNPAIHDDFSKILLTDDSSVSDMDVGAAAFFGESKPASSRPAFELDSVFQGEEALAKLQQSSAAGTSYAMAFVDVRMPPGWDGLETIRRLWQVDPDLEIVICTAYSDHSWQDIQQTLGTSDRLLILEETLDKVEVQQLAVALTEKWNLRRLARLQADGLQERLRLHPSNSEFWRIQPGVVDAAAGDSAEGGSASRHALECGPARVAKRYPRCEPASGGHSHRAEAWLKSGVNRTHALGP